MSDTHSSLNLSMLAFCSQTPGCPCIAKISVHILGVVATISSAGRYVAGMGYGRLAALRWSSRLAVQSLRRHGNGWWVFSSSAMAASMARGCCIPPFETSLVPACHGMEGNVLGGQMRLGLASRALGSGSNTNLPVILSG